MVDATGRLVPARVRGDQLVQDTTMTAFLDYAESYPEGVSQLEQSLMMFSQNPRNPQSFRLARRLEGANREISQMQEFLDSGNVDGEELEQIQRRMRTFTGQRNRILHDYSLMGGQIVDESGSSSSVIKFDRGSGIFYTESADVKVLDVGRWPGVSDPEAMEEVAVKKATERLLGEIGVVSGFGLRGDAPIEFPEGFDEESIIPTQTDYISAWEELSGMQARRSAAQTAAAETIKRRTGTSGDSGGGSGGGARGSTPQPPAGASSMKPKYEVDTEGFFKHEANRGAILVVDMAGNEHLIDFNKFMLRQNEYEARSTRIVVPESHATIFLDPDS